MRGLAPQTSLGNRDTSGNRTEYHIMVIIATPKLASCSDPSRHYTTRQHIFWIGVVRNRPKVWHNVKLLWWWHGVGIVQNLSFFPGRYKSTRLPMPCQNVLAQFKRLKQTMFADNVMSLVIKIIQHAWQYFAPFYGHLQQPYMADLCGSHFHKKMLVSNPSDLWRSLRIVIDRGSQNVNGWFGNVNNI